jgi:hypothetical protein
MLAASARYRRSSRLGLPIMPLFAQLSLSHLFLAGLLATSLFVLYRTRRKFQQTSSPRWQAEPNAPQRADKSHTAAAPAEVREWEVQFHELARDVSARIDSKMAALAHLLRAAHHETLRLEAAIGRAQAASLLPAEPPAAAMEFSQASQAEVLQQAARSGERRSMPHAAPKPNLERPTARIYALADAGHSSRRIALETGVPQGEVELILGLRRQEASL